MQRQVTGFHIDDVGDWVAELSCLHCQHVRHQPPFLVRPWVLTARGRAEHIGIDLECPLCERGELPEGLRLVRTAGPFDDHTVPQGLRRDHRVAERTWGLLRVLKGTVHFEMHTEVPYARDVHAGESQPIPPGVAHAVSLDAGSFEVDFLVAPRI